jgi:pre-rRNA-processing protein TSR4
MTSNGHGVNRAVAALEDEDNLATTSSSNVQLGYCVPFDSSQSSRCWQRGAHRSTDWRRDWDGGQVGGRPSWLEPQHLPVGPLLCNQCGSNEKGGEQRSTSSTHFVCQLYAPHPTAEHSFHRTLYVFACPHCVNRNGSNSGIRVLRVQLPKINPYWPINETVHQTDTDSTTTTTTLGWNRHFSATYHARGLCAVCGFVARGRCPVQQQAFCGRDHQILFKKHAKRGIENNGAANETDSLHSCTRSMLPGVYNAMELVVEEEPLMPASTPVDQENPLPTALFATNDTSNQDDAEDGNDSDQELDQDALNEIVAGPSNHSPSQERLRKLNDQTFQIFTDRITDRPNVKDQVLRYNCSWPNAAVGTDDDCTTENHHPLTLTKPLWIQHDHQPPTIPPCEYCGAPRQFEFQLMPQLLHYLVNECDEAARSTTASGQSQDEYMQTVAALQQTDAFLQQAPPETVSPHLVESRNAAVQRMRQQLLAESTASSSTCRLNWGVVAVYTCPRSCNTSAAVAPNDSAQGRASSFTSLGAYREEFAWVQPSIDSSQ